MILFLLLPKQQGFTKDPAFKNVSDVKKLVSKANAVCKKGFLKLDLV